MRIAVVGGGPAGLYFALLMKKADPQHQVTVFERNAADTTYGWGVVFSAGTLGELREADQKSFVSITDHFVRWSAIDVRHRGRVVRAGGQGFAAISRRALLGVLAERSRELEVELRYGREVTDLDQLSGYELVVGADGVHSRVRELLSGQFRPRFDLHPTRFAWFGTDLVFDAFTFIFQETPHGLFQVHAYPFDGESSTFIVECGEDTWRRAGLDRMDESESMAYCEEVFTDHLQGHKLASNRSVWIGFVTLRNRQWHHRNVVLVGDAAHTAHFSIGSGTKLAMEDAVALAQALSAHPSDIQAALAAYEVERQPPVERFQQAARESASYFENVARYMDFDPHQFAFNLLTRSGRMTHLGLARRDPGLVGRLDRRFHARLGEEPGIPAPPPMLARLLLGGVELVNRVVLAPDGDDLEAELRRAAALRPGLLVAGPVAVSALARITPESPGLYRADHLEAWAALLQGIHDEAPLRVAALLSHAGRRASTSPRRWGIDRPLRSGGWPLSAASPLPHVPGGPVPKELDQADMARARKEFAEAAGRAAASGFDAVLLDLAHGYLLAGFLSPLTNQRGDAYGGDLEARMRFPLEVFATVRQAWQGPVGARLSATDWVEGGWHPDDAVAMAAALAERGCDLIEVAAGHTVPEARPDYRGLFLVRYSDRIRNETGIPTMVGGGITTFDEVNTILAAGRADLCLIDPRLYTNVIVEQMA